MQTEPPPPRALPANAGLQHHGQRQPADSGGAGHPGRAPTARERLRLRHLSLSCQGSLWVQPRGQLPAAAPASGLLLPPAQLGGVQSPLRAHSEVLSSDRPPLLLAAGSSRCLPLFLVSSHTSHPDTPFLVGALGTGGRSRMALPPPHSEVTYSGPNQKGHAMAHLVLAFRAVQASQLSPHHSSWNSSKISHLKFRNPGSEGAGHLPQAGPRWVITSFDPHRHSLSGGGCYCPHFTDKETESQRTCWVTCARWLGPPGWS